MDAQIPQMTIKLNGTPQTIAVGISLAELLQTLDMAGQRVAIEVNEDVVPRSEYAETVLHEGDRVEIIRAIGGG